MGTLFSSEEPSLADYWGSMPEDEQQAYIRELQFEHRQMQKEKLGMKSTRRFYNPYEQ